MPDEVNCEFICYNLVHLYGASNLCLHYQLVKLHRLEYELQRQGPTIILLLVLTGKKNQSNECLTCSGQERSCDLYMFTDCDSIHEYSNKAV